MYLDFDEHKRQNRGSTVLMLQKARKCNPKSDVTTDSSFMCLTSAAAILMAEEACLVRLICFTTRSHQKGALTLTDRRQAMKEKTRGGGEGKREKEKRI